jgi:hypothetical protein
MLYPYYFYGSEDSLDEDVIIAIPRAVMPLKQEDRKVLIWNMQQEYKFTWNATLAVIEEGYIVDTIFPKSWIDRLNNALFSTYHLHPQVYPNPIKGMVKINTLLSIYKAVRTVLTVCTRTHFRPEVRPVMKGIHDFNLKIAALKKLDFLTIDEFNQKNTADVDIWKIIAFYIGQNISLLRDHREIYTKKDFLSHYPDLEAFIYRKTLSFYDKVTLQKYLSAWIEMLENHGEYVSANGILTCNDERINMGDETF